MRNNDLSGRVAIVTGASSGIGRATALALAREHAEVVLASRNAEMLGQVASEIRSLGSQSLIVPTDVSDQGQVDNLVKETIKWRGRVDILVANAGVYVRRPIVQVQLAQIERAMAINFYGAVYCVLAVLPHMLAAKRGHLVLVNTLDAKKPVPPDGPYVASKCALAGFGDVLRQELHGTGVSVTSVFPGRVDTPLIATLRVPWISAKIHPDTVAKVIVQSAYRPKAEAVVPRLGLILIYLNTVSPRLGDWLSRVLHFEGWETA